MKKFLALFLTVTLLLCSAALAEAPAIINGALGDGSWGAPYDHSVAKSLYEFTLDTDAKITAKVYYADTNEYFNTCVIDGAAADGLEVAAGKVVLNWHAVDEDGYHHGTDGQRTEVKYVLVIEVANAEGEHNETVVPFEFYYVHSIEQHVDYRTWFTNNHVNSFGPKFDGSWMTYSVVDLSQDGVQTFDLVAAGAWKLGTVNVTVNGDEVVVNYLCDEDVNTRDIYDDIYVGREWFTLFGDLAAVTTLNPDEIENPFAFGQPISIANDLGGDTNVILYVNNIMTYDNRNPYVTRFWPNLPQNKAVVESMTALLGE